MLSSGMEHGLNESYAALDRLLVTLRWAGAGPARNVSIRDPTVT